MAKPIKTQKNDVSVDDFLRTISEDRRADCLAVAALMRDATDDEPRMWGASIVGFGTYRYNDSRGEREWFSVGFAPRKNDLTLYIMPGFDDYAELMEKLGKHKLGKSCLHIKKLTDVDMDVLGELIRKSVGALAARD